MYPTEEPPYHILPLPRQGGHQQRNLSTTSFHCPDKEDTNRGTFLGTNWRTTEEPTENPPTYILPLPRLQCQRVKNSPPPTYILPLHPANSEGARNRVDRRKTYAGAHPIHVNNNTSESSVPPTLQAQNAATGNKPATSAIQNLSPYSNT